MMKKDSLLCAGQRNHDQLRRQGKHFPAQRSQAPTQCRQPGFSAPTIQLRRSAPHNPARGSNHVQETLSPQGRAQARDRTPDLGLRHPHKHRLPQLFPRLVGKARQRPVPGPTSRTMPSNFESSALANCTAGTWSLFRPTMTATSYRGDE